LSFDANAKNYYLGTMASVCFLMCHAEVAVIMAGGHLGGAGIAAVLRMLRTRLAPCCPRPAT
jgi:hypothetical protein